MTEPEGGKHVPILGNDFGMKAHLVIDQRGPTVYFWDDLKKCLSQTETQVSNFEEDTLEMFCLLQETHMDQLGEETINSSKVSKSKPVLPPSDPSPSTNAQQIGKKELKQSTSTSPQPRSQPVAIKRESCA